jgi:hypothetical protein
MASARGLLTTFKSLSISSPCIRFPSKLQVSPFSTTPVSFGGPVSRERRERAHAKLRKAKARAEELRIQRAARSNPVIGQTTEFTESLLRPREILPQPGIPSHSRSPEENWPILTNYGISSEDAMTLAVGAKAAGKRRIENRRSRWADPGSWSDSDKILYTDAGGVMAGKTTILEREDQRKREAMARLIDLTNASSQDVISANLEKAILHFARHEGDTGSPEVQGSFSFSKTDFSGSIDG